MNLIEIKKLINKGSIRSIEAKKNVLFSFIIKIFDFAIMFLMVPLLITYLDTTRYGIWITLTSIVSWFIYLDVGIGNGLRNKFSEAITLNKHVDARIYVSTAYYTLTIIVLSVISIFYLINDYIPWYKILNVSTELSTDLTIISFLVFSLFFINLITQLIGTIVVADQKPALRDLLHLIAKIFVVTIIYILTLKTDSSLLNLVIVYSGTPVLVFVFASIILYNTKYKIYSPNFKFVNFNYFRQIFGLGWKFLLIQISLVVILSTDNIIITQLYGPEFVTPYQITNKLFMSVFVIFILVLTPLWSASNEALIVGDNLWIKNSVDKVFKIFYLFIFILTILLIFSDLIYEMWIGNVVSIDFSLSLLWAIFSMLQMYLNIYFYVINGAGKVYLQMITYVLAMIINIPLSLLFAKVLGLGVNGVILSSIICQALHLFYLPKQYKYIVGNNLKGIWGK